MSSEWGIVYEAHAHPAEHREGLERALAEGIGTLAGHHAARAPAVALDPPGPQIAVLLETCGVSVIEDWPSLAATHFRVREAEGAPEGPGAAEFLMRGDLGGPHGKAEAARSTVPASEATSPATGHIHFGPQPRYDSTQ
eukprot:tig00000984_g5995.t1